MIKKPDGPHEEDIAKSTLLYHFSKAYWAVGALLLLTVTQVVVTIYILTPVATNTNPDKAPGMPNPAKASIGIAMFLSSFAMLFTVGVFFTYTRGRVSKLRISPSGDWLFIDRINMFAIPRREHLAIRDINSLPDMHGKMQIRPSGRTQNYGKIGTYAPMNQRLKRLVFDRMGKWHNEDIFKASFNFRKK